MRKKRAWLILAIIAWPVLWACVVVPVAYTLTLPGVILAIALCLAPAVSLGALLHRWWWERTGVVRADRAGLSLDGAPILRRRAIRSGYVHWLEGEPVVRLARAHVLGTNIGAIYPLDVVVHDEAAARALLEALGLDAAHALARFAGFYGGARRVWLGLALSLAPLLAFYAGRPLTFVWVLAALPAILYLLRASVSIAIGADGILIERRLGKRRFVPFADVDRASVEGKDLILRIRHAEVIRVGLSAGGRRLYGSDEAFNLHAAAQRIEEGRARYREHGSSGADTITLLARGGREVNEWLAALRGARDAVAGFRAPAIPPGELWRIVEDAAAPASTRAGAAIALSAELDDVGRARLRVAADTCAAQELRVVLGAVADDEPVDEALAALS